MKHFLSRFGKIKQGKSIGGKVPYCADWVPSEATAKAWGSAEPDVYCIAIVLLPLSPALSEMLSRKKYVSDDLFSLKALKRIFIYNS